MRRAWFPALLLIVLLIAFRAVGAAFSHTLPNFQPLPALFLCSLVFLSGVRAWALPIGVWLVSNPLASWLQGYPPFTAGGGVVVAFLALLLTGLLALPLRRQQRALPVLGACLAAALLFHGITNTAVWLADPGYAKSLGGLGQALWSGRPTDPMPTWVFLRNLAAANLCFAALFLIARRAGAPEVPATATAAVPTR